MLSSVLNSEIAININIQIIRIFSKIREMLLTHKDILRRLNQLNLPILVITGNIDHSGAEWEIENAESNWEWYEKDHFTSKIKKFDNITLIDFSFAKFNDIIFIRYNPVSASLSMRFFCSASARRSIDSENCLAYSTTRARPEWSTPTGGRVFPTSRSGAPSTRGEPRIGACLAMR